jgi:hypothetical protein
MEGRLRISDGRNASLAFCAVDNAGRLRWVTGDEWERRESSAVLLTMQLRCTVRNNLHNKLTVLF